MRTPITRPSPVATYLFALFTSVFISACATIPPESVDLSKQLGAGISKARSAHISTLDAFYQRLNKDNDAWIISVYLPKLITTSTSSISEACKANGDSSAGCATLGNGDIKTIIANTIQYRDEMQSALSKSHNEAGRLINDHYNDLLSANSGVTALLASAVDVSKATKESTAAVNKIAGLNIDTDAIEKAINKYLEKAGTVGAQISELETNLSNILNKSDNK